MNINTDIDNLTSKIEGITFVDKSITNEIHNTNNETMLKNILSYLRLNLTHEDLYELSTKCNAITTYCKGDGAGLLGGCLIDILVSKFFEIKLSKYTENKQGESDMKICDVPFSFKKINGKSTIALDWSKNKNIGSKEHFKYHILIINLKTSKWWKNGPKEKDNITYNDIIKAGIYIIDKNYCKSNITLLSNNKTNTLIDSISLYKMIKDSISKNLYIEIPQSDKHIVFNILNAFIE